MLGYNVICCDPIYQFTADEIYQGIQTISEYIVILNKNETFFMLKLSYSQKYLSQPKLKLLYHWPDKKLWYFCLAKFSVTGKFKKSQNSTYEKILVVHQESVGMIWWI